MDHYPLDPQISEVIMGIYRDDIGGVCVCVCVCECVCVCV